jgi:hypothetical protein
VYESLQDTPLDRPQFLRRLAGHFLVVSGLIAGSLALGMVGYVGFEHLSWVDAFLNASMLLGGMGPVNAPQTTGGKLFAGLYALYAGLVFIVSAAVMLTPVAHRVLHKLHFEDDDNSD